MKTIAMAATILFAAGAVSPALAAPICLRNDDVKSTDASSGRAIVFHMKNGEVWRNTLQSACPDLKFEGFAWDVRGVGEICENQQTLRVLNSGEICMLGKFTKLAPAKN